MSNFRHLAMIAIIFSTLAASGCGSSSSSPPPSPGWERIEPAGGGFLFDLPEPVEKSHMQGMDKYDSVKGDVQIRVGVIPRNFQAEKAEGLTDKQALKSFAEDTLSGLEQNLVKSGYSPQPNFDGDIEIPNGLGQQYTVSVGDQFVLNRFLIGPKNYYYLKIDNADDKNPKVAKFFDSFTLTPQ